MIFFSVFSWIGRNPIQFFRMWLRFHRDCFSLSALYNFHASKRHFHFPCLKTRKVSTFPSFKSRKWDFPCFKLEKLKKKNQPEVISTSWLIRKNFENILTFCIYICNGESGTEFAIISAKSLPTSNLFHGLNLGPMGIPIFEEEKP